MTPQHTWIVLQYNKNNWHAVECFGFSPDITINFVWNALAVYLLIYCDVNEIRILCCVSVFVLISGHFYKVNVPVMVTRGAQHVLTRPAQNSNPAPVAHGILAQLSNACHPATSDGPPHPPSNSLPLPSKQSAQNPVPSPSASPSEFTLDGIDFSPQPLDMSASSPFTPHSHFPTAYSQDPTETPFKDLQSIESTPPQDVPTKDSKVSWETRIM